MDATMEEESMIYLEQLQLQQTLSVIVQTLKYLQQVVVKLRRHLLTIERKRNTIKSWSRIRRERWAKQCKEQMIACIRAVLLCRKELTYMIMLVMNRSHRLEFM